MVFYPTYTGGISLAIPRIPARNLISVFLNFDGHCGSYADMRRNEMRDIYRPFVTGDDPDREVRCRDAMQFAFRTLSPPRPLRGGASVESIQAILCLAEDRLQMLAANDDTGSLRDMRKMAQTAAA